MSDPILIWLPATELDMVQEILAFIVNILIVDPIQAEMNERLAKVRAPQAVIADVRTCATASLPVLASRAVDDPAWAAMTALNVWIGTAAPEDVLSTASPQCDTAVRAAKAYLAGREV
jgi:hypothetical protein